MRAKIIAIGNSLGIRLPKPILDQTGIAHEVEIEVSGSTILLRPCSGLRAGWDAAFAQMAERGDDRLLDQEVPTDFARTDWEWT